MMYIPYAYAQCARGRGPIQTRRRLQPIRTWNVNYAGVVLLN
jgi:hypothetical protein